MHQLHRTWIGTECGKCAEELQGAQTLWHKFSDVCRDHQRNLVSVYPCGFSCIASGASLVPVIAGVSYELLRAAGRSDNPVINLISKPGLWMQGLTTKEPDDDMIEVGIASVEAVFDWRSYIAEIRAEEGSQC